MKVLVIGSGGREHAIVRKLAGERGVTAVYCAPGNPGIDRLATSVPISAVDVDALLAFAAGERIDLTIVGPEAPLERGIVDAFAARSLRIFGPTRAAAALECSKVFAKGFMARHGVPTARYRVCESAADAYGVVADGQLGFPLVVKADGLAAGKGVVIAPDRSGASDAIREAMEARRFGDAGSRVVLEECLTGPEVSFFTMCDGSRAMPIGSAQDHKRVFDNDEGPNTGGMGAFAPSPLVDAALHARIMDTIVTPVVRGMWAEGHEYRGFLYTGLMLTGDGPKVIEFNVRFGDPEAQVVLPGLDGELAPRLAAAADGALMADEPLPVRDMHVGVVLASAGYPGTSTAGVPIDGLDEAEALRDVTVIHAGTRRQHDRIVTAGGRVLTIVGRGVDYDSAIARAYEGVARIRFEGMHYRRDIGRKALAAGSRS